MADTENDILPFAYGMPQCSGVIRSVPEDFRVDEIPAFEPDGEGEHILLHIEKRDSNTDWIAGLLARCADVSRADVSYAGLKDRHAVTRQWFSIRLAGRPEPDWQSIESDECRILDSARHSRKLRIGALKGNRFNIRVRSFQGDVDGLQATLNAIALYGVPNYYGEQRFGTRDSNLDSARALFSGELKRVKRQKRGFYLSAARSFLFNRVLAARVAASNWNKPLAGERMMLDGTRSSFLAEEIDDLLLDRHDRMDIHVSGPLWGRGESMVTGEAAKLEQEVLVNLGFWCQGLEQFGLKMERRALRMPVSSLEWSLEGDLLDLAFTLPKGCFATTVLRECINYRQ
ncbi:tRNA pseudouridine(13) synthase TruD [Sedimenticola selenatireducens]|uniref:tRNA pseudouridine synthase D n=1 Tax=Sedimenticola selenatireducens TaxID=191960 RepID=A0A557SFZ2_9GAMM|nr:tRNA pseudouridine(13) synthase TruD [Sedimenticola selenatireducens]TVO76272.1 tRNA pseudouridine(13) synthase TruD [Sedimenticola selenatireducens]TVT61382.1 MAG: tRNA pseudouridine(13) synthase TruD [Sedimenticola selenatireducens]